MSDSSNTPLSPPDPQLEALLVDYLEALEHGESPDQQGLLARYPQYASQLAEFFANRERLDRIAEPLRNAVRAADAARSPGVNDETLGADVTAQVGTGAKLRYFGDYELIEEIARGGMGVVYKARQVSLNRTVALKMILAGNLASPADVQRFRAEAEAAARLDHPGIVPIFEVGEHAGQHYFSMAFVDGQSLAAIVRDNPLPAVQAAEHVKDIAAAVHYAHQQGVLHRDLKPSNILVETVRPSGSGRLTLDSRLRITDFGLAKQLHGASELTGTGQVLGTPSYMSPEQAAGKTREIGTASDIYSLGAILYELLTGRPPFRAESPLDTLLQVIEAEPASPRLLNQAIPRDLETICLKCLHKEPQARYESAQMLADDLGRFLEGDSILARRPGPIERAVRWARKQHRSVALTAGSAAAAAVLVLGVLLGTAGYRKWHIGSVQLSIENPPPIAELLHLEGQPVRKPISLPTQEPLEIEPGEYLLRISGPRRLSETMRLTIDRGQILPANVGLGDRLLVNALNVPNTFDLHVGPGRTELVLLSPKEVVLMHNVSTTTGLGLDPSFPWDWTGRGGFYPTRRDLRPRLMRPSPDLNGDGAADLLFCGQHHAWLLAYSGNQPYQPLWTVNRAEARVRDPKQVDPPITSAVLGDPVIIPDVDRDGRPDLAATFIVVPEDAPQQPQRWIEAFSGQSGRSLWRFDLDPAWFQVPLPDDVPAAMRWFTRTAGGGSIGGGAGISMGGAYRDRNTSQLDGDWHFAPAPCESRSSGDKTSLVCLAGTRLLRLDPATGGPSESTLELSFLPARAPMFADLDGDAIEDCVLVERKRIKRGDRFTANLMVLSGRDYQPLWPAKFLTAEWEENYRSQSPAQSWPVAADLNGDGRNELLTPNNSSRDNPNYTGGWGELEAIDGASGKSLWTRRLKTLDQQIDCFLVGEDLNRDGWRDVLVATLFARDSLKPEDLFVDALSGRDGSSLWSSREPLSVSSSCRLHPLQWWEAGPDGAPLVLVSLEGSGLYVFSSRTGRLVHVARGVPKPQLADINGDGLQDLVAHYAPYAQLDVIAAAPPELWRRLGNSWGRGWQTGADYDGDSIPDIVGTADAEASAAFSARTGLLLWRGEGGGTLQPLSVDLNGDQIADLLTSPAPGYFRKQSCVTALSGQDGRPLWASEAQIMRQAATLSMEARDLDGDGAPEIVCLAVSDLDLPLNRNGWTNKDFKLWLLVLSGRDGKVRWRQALSPGGPAKTELNVHDSSRLALTLADVNRDGTLDVLAPVFNADQTFAWRALNGHDGATIWEAPLLRSSGAHDISALSRCAVEDLDGDGQSEVVLQIYKQGEPTAGWILEGNSGRQRAAFQEKSPDYSYFNDRSGESAFNFPQPLILRQAGTRERLVGAWFWSSPARVVLRDSRGEEVRRIAVSQPTNANQSFRVWTADVDGNESDELLLIDQGNVIAMDPASGASLWKWPVPETPADIVATLPGTPPTIIVRAGFDVFALAGDTGKLVWRCPGPRTLGGHWPLPMSLLSTGSSSQPPLVLFQSPPESPNGIVCTRAAIGPGVPPWSPPAEVLSFDFPVSDRRTLRPLPWARANSNWLDDVYRMSLSCLLAVLMYIVPAWYLFGLIRDRRWSLRRWLLLPVVAGLFLLATQVPLKASYDLPNRLISGLAGVPLLILIGSLAVWTGQGRWRRVLGWIVCLLAFSAIAATIAITQDARGRPAEDQYDWSGGPLILLYGGYATSVVASIVVAFATILAAVRRRAAKPQAATG